MTDHFPSTIALPGYLIAEAECPKLHEPAHERHRCGLCGHGGTR